MHHASFHYGDSVSVSGGGSQPEKRSSATLTAGAGGLQPTGPDVGAVVELSDIWFDVQNGRSVEQVEVLDGKHVALDREQIDHREADGIGPARSASGEETPGLGVEEGDDLEAPSRRSVEVTQQDDVRETVEIAQTLGELREHLDGSACAVGSRWLDRCSLSLQEWAVNDAYRGVLDNHLLPPEPSAAAGADDRDPIRFRVRCGHAESSALGRMFDFLSEGAGGAVRVRDQSKCSRSSGTAIHGCLRDS